MKNVVALFLLLLSLTTTVYAQSIQLRGRILAGKMPVEYANVVLQTNDSVFVTGGVSDQRGRFSLENVQPGSYCLQVSGIGYVTKHVPIRHLAKSTDLGEVTMDSAAVLMDEVVVKASQVIHKDDKQIYLPNARQIKASTNGIDILQQMKLGRLQIDPMRKTITSSNEGDVQLRINGSKADIQEVQSLRPEDIQRIEYYDDPSMRFGEQVAAVIDYITKQRNSGGYIGVDLTNSPFTGFSNNGVIGKFNHKKSEFSLNYSGMYRNIKETKNDATDMFNYADGTTFTRQSDGLPTKIDENHHYVTMSYSYRESEKWSFVAKLKGKINKSIDLKKSDLYPINNPSDNVYMVDDSKDRTTSPSLSLYFQRMYKNKQFLIIDLVGTYTDTETHRYYSEDKGSLRLTDIQSQTLGKSYSLVGDILYEKGFKKDKIDVGVHYSQSYSNNVYSGTVNTSTQMHLLTPAPYAEYSGKRGNFDFRTGVMLVYARASQKGNDTYEKALFSPRVRLGYKIDKSSRLRLDCHLRYKAPSLSEMSNVEQLIDSLQIRRGNPDLKESSILTSTLYYEYRKGLFYGSAYVMYQYQHHPAMEEITREGNRFVITTLNQPSWQKVNPEIELKFGPIKNILNVSLTAGMNYFDSHGTDYRHYYTNWYYLAEISAMYKNFSMMFQIMNHKNYFYGETAHYGEAFHILSASYRINKGMTVGLMALNPFDTTYRRPSINYNRYAPSRSCAYLGKSILAATFKWDISFGRKYKSVEQKIQNEDTGTSTLKGRR